MSQEITIINNRYKYCRIHLLMSLITLLCISGFGITRDYQLMFVYSIFSLVIFTLLFLSEIKHDGLSVLILFFIGSFTRLVVPAITMSLAALEGEKFYLALEYTNYIFEGTVCMNIYYMLFIMSFTFFCKNKVLDLDIVSLLKGRRYLVPVLIIIYFVGFALRFVPYIEMISSTLASFATSLPQLVLLIFAFYAAYFNKSRTRILFYFFFCLELFYSVFFGFYKEAILYNLIDYALYYYLVRRRNGKKLITFKSVVLAILTAIFVTTFVFPFISLKRIESGYSFVTGTTSNYSTTEIIRQVLSGKAKDKINEENQVSFLERTNSIPANTYMFMGAQKDGFNSILVETEIMRRIPSFIRPSHEHDEINAGRRINSYMYYGTLYPTDTMSISGNFGGAFGSAYFWGGWIGVIICCLLNAYIFAFMFQFCMKWQKNIYSLYLLMGFVFKSFSCFEEVHDGGIGVIFSTLFSILIVIILNRLFHIRPVYEASVSKTLIYK